MKLLILGSTGSIGVSAVNLALGDLKNDIKVEAISFHNNAKLACEQAHKLGVKKAFTTSQSGYEEFSNLAPDIPIFFGADALKEECQNSDIDVVLVGISGFAGLEFVLASITQKERILAIANKEAIICGNHIIQKKIKDTKTRIIPVDSEHNSIFRLLQGEQESSIQNAFITSSGGAFLGRKFHTLSDVKIEEVVRHPVWKMGGKISVDSATMANKGLELIEAYNLFSFFTTGSLEAYISQGSLLHAGIYSKDGALKLFISKPDMRLHIANSILGGKIQSLACQIVQPQEISNIKIEEIKHNEFPIFFIAKEIAETRNIKGAISFNILNEIAVELFLKSKIKYTEILKIIELNLQRNCEHYNFETFEEIKEYEIFLKKSLTK